MNYLSGLLNLALSHHNFYQTRSCGARRWVQCWYLLHRREVMSPYPLRLERLHWYLMTGRKSLISNIICGSGSTCGFCYFPVRDVSVLQIYRRWMFWCWVAHEFENKWMNWICIRNFPIQSRNVSARERLIESFGLSEEVRAICVRRHRKFYVFRCSKPRANFALMLHPVHPDLYSLLLQMKK